MSDQRPFGTDDFAENPEPRCPCLLLLDVSGSMAGAPIQELNAGLVSLRDELIADELASRRVEVACVTFGPVNVATGFEPAAVFQPPWLKAAGDTPMGEAIVRATDLVRERKAEYRRNGIAFYRPWILLLSDGAPTDAWADATARVRDGEASRSFAFFAVGVRGASMDVLRQISVREPLRLADLRFRSLFQWLSNSMKSVSRSVPGEQVRLQDPREGPDGWAQI
jgi:uncharacterized protein YegL